MTDTSTLQGEGAASAPTHLNGVFLSEKSKLFWLALWTGALTIVTFGLYRFWARTRLRRYIWSSIKPGEIPLNIPAQGWKNSWDF